MKRKRKRRARGEGAAFFSESKQSWVGRAQVGKLPTGGPRYKEVSAKTQGEVLARMRKAIDDAKARRLRSGKPLTVGQHLHHWLENVAKISTHETTWRSYERVVRLHLLGRIGGVKLADLYPEDVERLFADLDRDGVSKGNARKVREVLATAIQHAVRTGLLPMNPVAAVAAPRPDETPISPFTPEEITSVLREAQGHRLEAMIVLAVASGMREGELLALGREHIDLDRGEVRVERTLATIKGGFLLKEPKSKRGKRVVALPQFAVDALRERCKTALMEGNAGAPVLFCTKTGNFISKSSFIRQVWRPLLKRAGVPYRRFHGLRHTHVSELLRAGESVVDVAQRIGDRVDVLTKVYAHEIRPDAGRITRHLDALYGHSQNGRIRNPESGVRVEIA
jgi:integrase